jgi:hypothetical protein
VPRSGTHRLTINSWSCSKAKDSPLGVIQAGRVFEDASKVNKTSAAFKAWKKAVKAAGKAAMKDLEDEIVDDDPFAQVCIACTSLYVCRDSGMHISRQN